MTDNYEFEKRNKENIKAMSNNDRIKQLSTDWFNSVSEYEYSYHFKWLGLPIIQFPQDIIVMQEIIWQVKPDLVIETGIARGGSLIFYSSILDLLGGSGEVLGIDIDIRQHNRIEIERHPMFKRITMLEGSSIDKNIIKKVSDFIIKKNKKKVVVILDSNHTHEHVLRELELYSPFVTKESYLVVFDTVVEDMPEGYFPNRPWGKGNNPKTAVWEFLKTNDRFIIDKEIENKLLITVAPNGYLKCIED